MKIAWSSLAFACALATSASAQTQITQEAYLKASNPSLDDRFGGVIAVSGDTIVVGVRKEDSDSSGVNGGQEDVGQSFDSGAAYVFVRDGAGWSQQAYIKASNAEGHDSFGVSVDISGDTIVVGAFDEASQTTGVNNFETNNSAPGAGAAYVFVRSGTTWTQQAYLKASHTGASDRFCWVTIFGDTIAVGAPGESSDATGVNGDQTNDNADDSGAAYVFVRNGTSWTQQAYIKASNTEKNDRFGFPLTLWGDTLVVAATGEESGSTGVNGDQANNDIDDAGAAYVFVREGTIWSQQAYIKASNPSIDDHLASDMSLWGDTLVIGAYLEDSIAGGINGDQSDNSALGAGAAYVFVRNGTTWSQQAYLKASNAGASDNFGFSVSLSGTTAVIGAPYEDGTGTGLNGDPNSDLSAAAGAAYVFRQEGTTWTQHAYLKSSNNEVTTNPSLFGADAFGSSVSLSRDTLVVGALSEDSASPGVNGDESDNSLQSAGAAYAFDLALDDFCSGDGGDQSGCTDCPCGNTAPQGTIGGCLHSAGTSTRLSTSGSDSLTAADLRFDVVDAPPGVNAILLSGTAQAPANPLNPCFGQSSGIQSTDLDGLRCVVMNILRHGVRPSDANGAVGDTTNGWGTPDGFASFAAFLPGATRHFQVVHRDDPQLGCGTGLNSSQGIAVRFTP